MKQIKGGIMMLNQNQKAVRQRQIQMHKSKPKKVYQYSLRLDKQHYQMLHDLAEKSTMAKVIDRALEVEFDYEKKTADFVNVVARLKTKSAINDWVVQTFNNSPEVLSKLAKTGAIMEHTKLLKAAEKTRQNYLNDLDTIAYLINKFGVNLNQIAKKANQGVDVPAIELNVLGNELAKLNLMLESIRKKLG